MTIDDFDYDLPQAAIATTPLPERDASRLLVLDRRSGSVSHRVFRDLPALLSPGDLLVVNRSRVFPARLLGTRPVGGPAEFLLLRPVAEGRWEALVRPGRRLRAGTCVQIANDFRVHVETDALAPDGRRRVRLEADSGDLADALDHYGHTPLPPYIRRPDSLADRERYQTVYASESGSVAAPTAGLHFTDATLRALSSQRVARAEILLHVGPGTFRPVKAARLSEHKIEAEPYWVTNETAEAARQARQRGGRTVAVGTTTVRALESAASKTGRVEAGEGKTDLVILPGFAFHAVDALITNFHLPRSSLLMLVCAFAGRERVLSAYTDAVRSGYRFYSYGDAMLIL